MANKLLDHLSIIYKDVYTDEEQKDISEEILTLVKEWKNKIKTKHLEHLSEKDVYLITYADGIRRLGETSFPYLKKFADEHLKDIITKIHLLPFFDWSNDDGFGVKDYYSVFAKYGKWEDVKDLSENFDLMFDLVINHISTKGTWFNKYLDKDPEFENFFIEKNEDWNYDNFTRPRTSPLFHEFETKDKELVNILTTFSEEQADINFRNKNVLLKSIDILMYYFSNGSTSIRLDAIGFIWKEDNTTSIHLKQCHEIIKLWRSISEIISDKILLITETNVPMKENITYFGNDDEAHMVYQFPLPPLTLYSFLNEDSTLLTKWTKELEFINRSKKITFFNFLSSHDGVGLRPLEGIVKQEDINKMADIALTKGGKINYRTLADGSKLPYEMNINFYSALENKEQSDAKNIKRFIAAHVILLSLVGVPAIYYHSLLGSKNNVGEMKRTHINRRINRKKYDYYDILDLLDDELTINSKVFKKFKEIIKVRQTIDAFNPYGKQEVLDINSKVFAIKRFGKKTNIIFIVNLTNEEQEIDVDVNGEDVFTNEMINKKAILKPYQYMWIKVK